MRASNRGSAGKQIKLIVETLIRTVVLVKKGKYNFKEKLCEACIIQRSREQLLERLFYEGQARKSARGMPWHQEPMKVVTSCDKLRGVAHKH